MPQWGHRHWKAGPRAGLLVRSLLPKKNNCTPHQDLALKLDLSIVEHARVLCRCVVYILEQVQMIHGAKNKNHKKNLARCRSHSHVLRTLIWVRCECRVRSLFERVRSERKNCRRLCPFRYHIRRSPAKVPSAFVGGTPHVCAPRQCDGLS